MKKSTIAGALAGAVLLAGCGGGGSHTHSGSDGGVNPPPVALLDTFFVAVSNLTLTTSEDKEGVSIDAITATSPDDTEPVPL